MPEPAGIPGQEFRVTRDGHPVPGVLDVAEGDLIRIHRPGSNPATVRVTSAGTPDGQGCVTFTSELVREDA